MCHLAFDARSSTLFCANYDAGSVAALPVSAKSSCAGTSSAAGKDQVRSAEVVALGPPASWRHTKEGGAESGVVGSRQDAAHPHGVFVHPSGKWLTCCDLGSNRVHCYELLAGMPAAAAAGAAGAEEEKEGGGARVPRVPGVPGVPGALKAAGSTLLHGGAGPRHLEFHPEGHRAFVVNELDNTVSVISFDAATGLLEELGHVSTLPAGWLDGGHPKPFDFYTAPSHAAAIRLAGDARHLYVSNRGHDSIAIFGLGDETAGNPTGLTLLDTVPSSGRLPWAMAWAGTTGPDDTSSTSSTSTAETPFLLVQNQYAAAACFTI